MEKTMARAIYKKMAIGVWYTSYELYRLVEDDYPPTGKDVRKVVASEMWKVVNTGYAETKLENETYHIVRGLRYNVPNRDWSKVPTQTYTVRYWRRIK
jgi:hypothetical protein